MAERSNRAANFLRGLRVARGDRVLVMLPNVVPLWEITLAGMKLGAVLSPATTLLSTADAVPCGANSEHCKGRLNVARATGAKP